MENSTEGALKALVRVKLVWGGTGESKSAEVPPSDKAGDVFGEVYKVFHQQPTDQDTYEINGTDFPKSRFGEPVKKIEHEFGQDPEFEVVPPASGA